MLINVYVKYITQAYVGVSIFNFHIK